MEDVRNAYMGMECVKNSVTLKKRPGFLKAADTAKLKE
jgi:hypothetical protein